MKKHALIIGDIDSLEKYLDFEAFNYSLITSEYEYKTMKKPIKPLLLSILRIKTSSEFDACCFEKEINTIINGTSRILKQYGSIDCVITTHEHTILPAAIIREKFDVNGLSYEEALKVRNKKIMKQHIEKSNIKIPKYLICNKETPEIFVDEFLKINKNVFVKPSNQAGCFNILSSNNSQVIKMHINKLLDEEEEIVIEESVEGTVMHFDGIAVGGEVKFLSVSEKIGSCYDYVNLRKPLTTIINNEKAMYRAANQYVNKCLNALQINNLVFHLEVFYKELTDEFIFLEIAGRYPGSGITSIIESVFNIDLVKASYEMDCLKFEFSDLDEANLLKEVRNTMGRMLIPTPLKKDLKVKSINGLDMIPSNVIYSKITGPGNVVPFTSINAFQSVCEFIIEDSDKERIFESVNSLNKTIQLSYEEE